MDSNKLLSLLGLAQKAGKVKSGEFSTESEIKAGKARLVLLSEEASENTLKKFRDMCSYRGVPMHVLPVSKDELGRHIGKAMRTSCAVSDAGFAGAMLKLLETDGSTEKPRKTKKNDEQVR